MELVDRLALLDVFRESGGDGARLIRKMFSLI